MPHARRYGHIRCPFLNVLRQLFSNARTTSTPSRRLIWRSMDVSDSLAAALARHQIELPTDQVERLDQYCRLLWEWNTKLNLTRHTDYEKFVGRDVVDTLQLAAHLREGEEVLDVGTGGGVPGVVLAILHPDLKVTLCDSVAKKARAVESMVNDLGLEVPVMPFRAEELLEDTRYDALVI